MSSLAYFYELALCPATLERLAERMRTFFPLALNPLPHTASSCYYARLPSPSELPHRAGRRHRRTRQARLYCTPSGRIARQGHGHSVAARGRGRDLHPQQRWPVCPGHRCRARPARCRSAVPQAHAFPNHIVDAPLPQQTCGVFPVFTHSLVLPSYTTRFAPEVTKARSHVLTLR